MKKFFFGAMFFSLVEDRLELETHTLAQTLSLSTLVLEKKEKVFWLWSQHQK